MRVFGHLLKKKIILFPETHPPESHIILGLISYNLSKFIHKELCYWPLTLLAAIPPPPLELTQNFNILRYTFWNFFRSLFFSIVQTLFYFSPDGGRGKGFTMLTRFGVNSILYNEQQNPDQFDMLWVDQCFPSPYSTFPIPPTLTMVCWQQAAWNWQCLPNGIHYHAQTSQNCQNSMYQPSADCLYVSEWFIPPPSLSPSFNNINMICQWTLEQTGYNLWTICLLNYSTIHV